MATAWVLLLVTVVLGLARAGPVPTSKPTTTRRGCHIGRFQSLSPRELEAFKKAKDALEESLSLKNWNCSSRLFPRTRDPRHLQAWKRPVALEAEVGLTVKVLGTSADSPLGVVLGQPLHMLRHIHSELQACVPAQPTPRSKAAGSLHHWLRGLQEAPRKESQGRLEASVTCNVFRLLTRDLTCVASGDLRLW
ncbi:interferon lambda-1-like [Manis pentadactyla]|uniref:interferon lambda-1-like n=1 Tax=Manis pentadactyla TaxID=143292 RepID=UPI00255CBFBB|nr:interferon lambda-1-like [Manis pentadactyla]